MEQNNILQRPPIGRIVVSYLLFLAVGGHYWYLGRGRLQAYYWLLGFCVAVLTMFIGGADFLAFLIFGMAGMALMTYLAIFKGAVGIVLATGETPYQVMTILYLLLWGLWVLWTLRAAFRIPSLAQR